jgi:mono/diheme cytochrome c family protein
MRRRQLLFGLMAAATLLLVVASAYAWTREDDGARAASGSDDEEERGRALFLSAGCAGCHNMTSEGIVSGFGGAPDLSRIAQDAGNRVDGQSAEQYVRTSIVAPDAFYAPGWSVTFTMPQLELTPDQVNALVAFLLAGGEHSPTP